MENLSRRKLLASAGVATGAAAIAAAPSVAQAALDHPEVTDPSGPPPEEAVVAIVRDAKRGEVTVMSGTSEVTVSRPGTGEAAAEGRARRARSRQMSSHREAPEISKDPVADNTDTYAFVSPDKPDTVTIITNYIPLEDPPGGPNFFEFGDDVLYSIYVDNDGDGLPDIEYRSSSRPSSGARRRSSTTPARSASLDSPNWNRRQFYDVSRVDYTNKSHHNGHKPKPKVLGQQPAPARRATSGRARRRTTRRRSRDPAVQLGQGRSTCSPGSATRGSSSTSGRSSTSATCGRCRTCT